MMKSVGVFLLLLIAFNQSVAQWRKIDLSNDHPTGEVTDASFVNADTGFVSTSWGVLYGTEDGGQTWTADTIDSHMYILRVAFPTAQVGYITGIRDTAGESIFKTTDGGKHWVGSTHGYGMQQLNGLYFLNADTGFVANDLGVVLKTMDGGQTWSYYSTGTQGAPIFDIRFINDSVGLIYGNSGSATSKAGISVSYDGGQTWPYYPRLNFFDAFEGSAMLYSDSVIIAVSTSSSQIIRLKVNQNENDAVALYTPPPQNPRFSPGALFAREFAFIDSNIGMVAYDGAVIRTVDGGHTWTLTDTSAFKWSLGYIVGVTANRWLVMGSDAQLYITDNGGGIATVVADIEEAHMASVYPNPTTGPLKITPPANGGSNYNVEINNIVGQTVFKAYANNNQIDVSSLVPGIYLLKLKVDGVSQTAKFVKQ